MLYQKTHERLLFLSFILNRVNAYIFSHSTTATLVKRFCTCYYFIINKFTVNIFWLVVWRLYLNK